MFLIAVFFLSSFLITIMRRSEHDASVTVVDSLERVLVMGAQFLPRTVCTSGSEIA